MRRRFSNLLDKLASQEQEFLKTDFMSPVLRAKKVRVRLAGIIMNLAIEEPKNFQGWGVFRPTSNHAAKFVREPTMAERQLYLRLFPTLRLIICGRDGQTWLGSPARSSDTRFKVDGIVPIRLAGEVQLFDTVVTRFDGESCWYEGPDNSASLRNAGMLRESLASETDVANVAASGLTKEEKEAYLVAFIREIEDKKDRSEERIKAAIVRAGGTYRSYVEREASYTIEYAVDGQVHKSIVNKETLSVESAGICLSGGDKYFDLQSLVGVIREGINRDSINRVTLGRDYGYGNGDRYYGEGAGNHDDDDYYD
jgi:hypothetical protein